jgi:hypothetical protein
MGGKMSKVSILSSRKSWWHWLCLSAVLLLVGCGASPASTPVPTSSPTPKSGHWSNEGSAAGEATVAFDLAADGKITNFTMKAPLQGKTCTMNVSQLQLQLDNNGTFEIAYLMSYDEVKTALGPAVMELMKDVIKAGQPYEVLHINGKASDTALDGSFMITVCGHTMYPAQNTGTWTARWKSS